MRRDCRRGLAVGCSGVRTRLLRPLLMTSVYVYPSHVSQRHQPKAGIQTSQGKTREVHSPYPLHLHAPVPVLCGSVRPGPPRYLLVLMPHMQFVFLEPSLALRVTAP